MSLFTSTERQWSERNPKSNAGLSSRVLREQVFIQDWRRNNCRILVVEHVLNVLGMMESCPTYFNASPKPRATPRVRQFAERRGQRFRLKLPKSCKRLANYPRPRQGSSTHDSTETKVANTVECDLFFPLWIQRVSSFGSRSPPLSNSVRCRSSGVSDFHCGIPSSDLNSDSLKPRCCATC